MDSSYYIQFYLIVSYYTLMALYAEKDVSQQISPEDTEQKLIGYFLNSAERCKRLMNQFLDHARVTLKIQ